MQTLAVVEQAGRTQQLDQAVSTGSRQVARQITGVCHRLLIDVPQAYGSCLYLNKQKQRQEHCETNRKLFFSS